MLMWTTLNIAEDDTQDAIDLFRQCVEARADITSGELKLDVNSLDVNDGSIDERASGSYHIIFDEESMRFDRFSMGNAVKRVVSGNRFMEFDGKLSHGATIGSLDRVKDQSPTFSVFDPRIIGMNVALPFHWYLHRWSDFLDAEPDACTVREEKMEGIATRHVHYVQNERTIDVWIAPHQGPSVIRADMSSKFNDGVLADSITCWNKTYRNGGVWFPERLRHRRIVNDEVVSEHSVEVVQARFNIECGRKPFTLSGLGLPKGCYIHEEGAPSAIWDGQAAVSPHASSDSDVPASANRRNLLFGCTIAVLALAIGFYFGKKRS